MRGTAFLIAVALPLAACTSNPVPDGYTGSIVRITDSVTPRSSTSADFFYLSKVNGRRIEDSLSITKQVNSGQGFAMIPRVIGRVVPAEPSTFTIVGRTHYAAPILDLMNTVYEVSGETKFTPIPHQSYVVKGVLGENYSAVWIEDSQTGEVVGQKIEIKGSSALGILEK